MQNVTNSQMGLNDEAKLAAMDVAAKQLTALHANGINVQATRHARRVYVGALTADVDDAHLTQFFEKIMLATGATKRVDGGCVVSTYINREKLFAFIEFQTVEEASNALGFDGVVYGGQQLRLRRPNDYNIAQASLLGPQQPNPNLNYSAIGINHTPTPMVASTENSTSPYKLFVGGLPNYITENQVKELVCSFGEIKAFNLVFDKDTGLSKGYAFWEFLDPSVSEAAIKGLDGMRLGEKLINVKFANGNPPPIGGYNAAGEDGTSTVAAQQQLGYVANVPLATATALTGGVETTCVRLKGMVSREELADPTEAAEILEDTEEECKGFGSLVKVLMPRPGPHPDLDPIGVGEVMLKFATVECARRAQRSLNGRKFADRLVGAVFVKESVFDERDRGDA